MAATGRQREALALLATFPRPISAGIFARRFWAGKRVRSGHWQRAGAWLRKLADLGWVHIHYGDDYDTFSITEQGRSAID
jgi:elongation factor P hydroxylase